MSSESDLPPKMRPSRRLRRPNRDLARKTRLSRNSGSGARTAISISSAAVVAAASATCPLYVRKVRRAGIFLGTQQRQGHTVFLDRYPPSPPPGFCRRNSLRGGGGGIGRGRAHGQAPD